MAAEPDGDVVASYASGLWLYSQSGGAWGQLSKSVPTSFQVDESGSTTTAGNVVAVFSSGLWEYTIPSNGGGTGSWAQLSKSIPTSFMIDDSSDKAFTGGNVVALFSSGLWEYTQQGNTDNGAGDGTAGWTQLTKGIPTTYTIDTSADANFTQGNIVASFSNGLWEYTQEANTNGGAGSGTPLWTILSTQIPNSFQIDESGSLYSQGNVVASFSNGLWEYQQVEIPAGFNSGSNPDIAQGWYQVSPAVPGTFEIDDSAGGLNTAGNIVATFSGKGLYEYTQQGNTDSGAADGTPGWTKLSSSIPTSFSIVKSSSAGNAAPGAVVAQFSTGLWEYNPAIPANFFSAGNPAYSAGWVQLSSAQTTSFGVDSLGDVWAGYSVGGLIEYTQNISGSTYGYKQSTWLASAPSPIDVSTSSAYLFNSKFGLYEFIPSTGGSS
jgi:hypothetical protein